MPTLATNPEQDIEANIISLEAPSPEKTLAHRTLPSIIVPIAAVFSSLSIPLTIIALEQRFNPNTNVSYTEKGLKTLLPYAPFLVCRCWLMWHRVGARLDGKADQEININVESKQDAPKAVIIAMVANCAAFTNGFIIALHQMQNTSPIAACSAGFFLGGLNYAAELTTDVADAFRKYVESEKKKGREIHPFFKQQLVQDLFEHHIEKFGMFLREAYPLITGIIRSRASADMLERLLQDKISPAQLSILKVITCLMIYQSSAYFAKFDVIQLHDNLNACQLHNFPLENTLTKASCSPIKMIGELANGQLLMKILRKMKLSIDNSVNTIYAFAALGFMTLIFSILEAYISSTNQQAVEDNKEGLLLNYYFGKETAQNIAPAAFIACTCIATTLGAVGIFSQTATIKKYANSQPQTANTPQVFVTNTTEELPDRVYELPTLGQSN